MLDILVGAGRVLIAVALLEMVVDVLTREGPSDPLMAFMALGMVGAVTGIVHRFEQGAAQQPASQEALL
ncbi:hypothetical protein [Kocuria sabuli]|uniref:hypothetical protein n=1 Tax=Kocuria sabuli TaxID=3071448 RepID=UPI0034D758BA